VNVSQTIQRVDRVVIVGGVGGTNVGESLMRAGADLGCKTVIMDAARAMSSLPLMQSLMWRLGGHRPLYLGDFSRRLVATHRFEAIKVLLVTGAGPVTHSALKQLRAQGVICINYSTDDPWNPAHRAPWHLRALPEYNVVFTPRRSNIGDFRALGCADVRYLPFGYDPHLFGRCEPAPGCEGPPCLFVGGADRDRVEFFRAFIRAGGQPTLVGGYWDRHTELRSLAIGHKSAAELCQLTAGAAVNLCLVRRANRDGHVMRSLEIPAVGGFMIAEDTGEHRELFGGEGECVLYFRDAGEAARKARWALERPAERRRMANACHARIIGGGHTYTDRLRNMLAAVPA